MFKLKTFILLISCTSITYQNVLLSSVDKKQDKDIAQEFSKDKILKITDLPFPLQTLIAQYATTQWLNYYSFLHHTKAINSLTVTNDNKLLCSSSYDNTGQVWDLDSCESLKSLCLTKTDLFQVSPDSKYFLLDRRHLSVLKDYRNSYFNPVLERQLLDGQVKNFTISPESKFLIYSVETNHRKLRLKLKNIQIIQTLSNYNIVQLNGLPEFSNISFLKFVDSNSLVLSTNLGIFLCNLIYDPNFKKLEEPSEFDKLLTDILFEPAKLDCYSAQIQVIDKEQSKHLAVSGNGKYLVYSKEKNNNSFLNIFDIALNKIVDQVEYNYCLDSIAFSHDAQYLAIAYTDKSNLNKLTLWNLFYRENIQNITLDSKVTELLFGNNNSLFAGLESGKIIFFKEVL